MSTVPPVHHDHPPQHPYHGNHSVFRFSSGHLASILASVLTAGMIGSFSLLWSMSHSLTRINEKLDVLYARFQTLDAAQASIQRELVLLERRLSILEQRVGNHGRPN